jgi:predicted phosphodiesterase
MNHALLDRLTGSSDGMMWRQNADHEQKRETGDVTITLGDLTSPGPLQKLKLNLTEVSCPHGESRAEAGRGAVGVAKRPASAHWRTP